MRTTSAYAQGMRRSKRHGQGQRTEQPKPKADDKGYNAALSRIPVPEKKYDPWQKQAVVPRPLPRARFGRTKHSLARSPGASPSPPSPAKRNGAARRPPRATRIARVNVSSPR